MQISIVKGIYTNNVSDIAVSFPKNLMPVIQESGISSGYLRPTDGIVSYGNGPGISRGAINWKDNCYRVMGEKLVRISSSGSYVELGTVDNDGLQVRMDYSFTHLGIVSSGKFYLYDGESLRQVTDRDLGFVIDGMWIDGYWMLTDGEYLIVTELNDPFTVLPTKYGSSEIDPDPIVGLKKLRNEAYAINRNTIEIFDNRGGTGFPFQRVSGAQIERGSVGTFASCIYMEKLVFVGGGRNEGISVYFAINGQTQKISTMDIDKTLATYSEHELSKILCETRVGNGENQLWIRLPDKTFVYDYEASAVSETPIWHVLSSSPSNNSEYRAQNLVYCYGKFLVGDTVSAKYGYLSESVHTHWGESVGWEFSTQMLYNKSKGAVINSIELVSITGRMEVGESPSISTQYSVDGQTFSQPRFISIGKSGQRTKRIVWFRQGFFRNFRIQKFNGNSDSMTSFARLEIEVEPLSA